MKHMERAERKPRTAEFIEQAAKAQGVTREEIIRVLDLDAANPIFINDIYQVQVNELEDGVTHLNIRRRDGKPIFRDWRHFQQIKNELCGPQREGIELYPAESRLVDSSNKYHIYVAPLGFKFPFGWHERDVTDEKSKIRGLRQRPFHGGTPK